MAEIDQAIDRHGGWPLCDKTEQTISPAKALDEGVIEFPVTGCSSIARRSRRIPVDNEYRFVER